MQRVIFSFITICFCFATLLFINNRDCQANGFDDYSAAAAQPVRKLFTIEDQERLTLIYPNTTKTSEAGAPLVLVFHGHGGNVRNASQKMDIHNVWPDAVVVYLQGLPGVPGVTDPEGVKTGWQKDAGTLGDRDLKFVDAVLAQLPMEYKIDTNRIYALGFSNGARFTTLLWNTRGEKFAGFCAAAGNIRDLVESSAPKPIFIIAGENDPLVPIAAQLLSIEAARQLLQTDPTKAIKKGFATSEPGINDTELATYIHPGRHVFPHKSLPLIAQFFQRHSLQ